MFVCGQMGHRANQCQQNQQKSQPPALSPPAPIQQVPGPSGYAPMGYGGAYRYQGVIAPYSRGPYQYLHDSYYQGGYAQYSGGYAPYPVGGS